MTKDKKVIVDWFSTYSWTHSATINLKPRFKASFVCGQFLRNFNRAIFGRFRVEPGPRLIVLSVYADDSKVKHIHFALGGFPSTMAFGEIEKAFHKAARQTKGVWVEIEKSFFIDSDNRDCGPSFALPMVKIDVDSSPRKWLSYILRFSNDINDKHILLEYSYFG